MSRERQRTYEFGAFSLDVAEQRLLRDGRAVPLTPKIFELLRVLVENAGHLVEKERLLKEVWPDTFVEEANLNRGISVLRKALGETSTAAIHRNGAQAGLSIRRRRPRRIGNGGTGDNREARPLPLVNEQPNAEEVSIPRRRRCLSAGNRCRLRLLTIGAIVYAVVGRRKSNRQLMSRRCFDSSTAHVYRQGAHARRCRRTAGASRTCRTNRRIER